MKTQCLYTHHQQVTDAIHVVSQLPRLDLDLAVRAKWVAQDACEGHDRDLKYEIQNV